MLPQVGQLKCRLAERKGEGIKWLVRGLPKAPMQEWERQLLSVAEQEQEREKRRVGRGRLGRRRASAIQGEVLAAAAAARRLLVEGAEGGPLGGLRLAHEHQQQLQARSPGPHKLPAVHRRPPAGQGRLPVAKPEPPKQLTISLPVPRHLQEYRAAAFKSAAFKSHLQEPKPAFDPIELLEHLAPPNARY